MDTLPPEIWISIVEYLDIESFKRFISCSKELYNSSYKYVKLVNNIRKYNNTNEIFYSINGIKHGAYMTVDKNNSSLVRCNYKWGNLHGLYEEWKYDITYETYFLHISCIYRWLKKWWRTYLWDILF